MALQSTAFPFLTILGLITILLIFGMKHFSALWQARARMAGEGAYRDMAERIAAAQTAHGEALSLVQADVTEIKLRLAGIEKILREVE